MLKNAFSTTHSFGKYIVANRHSSALHAALATFYRDHYGSTDIDGDLQSIPIGSYFGRSASSASLSNATVSPKGVFNIRLNGNYSKADSLAWPVGLNTDVYTVTLPQRSSFNVAIKGFSKNVNLGIFTLTGQRIASSTSSGNIPESINLKTLAAGKYLVKVSLKVPVTDILAQTRYQIFMSRAKPSNILVEEADLRELRSVVNRFGTVNDNDTSDIYRFNLSRPVGLDLSLSGLSNDANLRLIRDVNRNGWIDASDVVASSIANGNAPETINLRWLASGSYFVQVHQQDGATNYSLNLDRKNSIPLSFRPVADTYIRNDLDIRANDNYGRDNFVGIGTGRGSSLGPWGTADAMRSLIRFDLSGISGRLNQATLRLRLHSVSSSNTPFQIGIYRITQPWQEGNGTEGDTNIVPGATGTDSASGVAWSAIDANNQAQPSFGNTAIASRAIDPSTAQPGDIFEWDITPLVRSWLANPSSNYGLMLRDVTTDGTFRELRFGSREADLYSFPNEVPGPILTLTMR